MNLNNITLKTQEALQRAQQIAFENNHQLIEVGHILKGIFEVDENVTPYIFKKLSANLPVVKQALNSILDSYPKQEGGGQHLSRPANEAVQRAGTFLKEFGDEYVALEHLLLGILKVKDSVSQLLKDSGLNEKDLKAAIKALRKGTKVTSHGAESTYNSLAKYAINLNEKAKKGKLDPVIGRDEASHTPVFPADIDSVKFGSKLFGQPQQQQPQPGERLL